MRSSNDGEGVYSDCIFDQLLENRIKFITKSSRGRQKNQVFVNDSMEPRINIAGSKKGPALVEIKGQSMSTDLLWPRYWIFHNFSHFSHFLAKNWLFLQ